MANTTENEFPKQSRKLSAKDSQEQEIKERYQKGENLYHIAHEVYGFSNDEALQRIKDVLGIMHPPVTQILE